MALTLEQALDTSAALTERIAEAFEPEIMVPQVGQGAIAIECRDDAASVIEALAAIDDAASRRDVETERAFLAESRKRARLLALGRGATVLAALLVVTLGVLAKTWVDAAHASEAQARAAAVEEWFPVSQVGSATFLRQIDVSTAPYLHGYVSTKMKPVPAEELLQSDTEEPILARWRVGLGWSLAWTSDLKNRWAVEWIHWPRWQAFWTQLVREHMRQRRREMPFTNRFAS